jgi:predicted RNA binding protein YcfA (HicA-like mRNA interferase family)
MPKLPVINARVLVRVLKKLGFVQFHQVGSHAQFKNNLGRRTTVSMHSGEDVGKKTLTSILSDMEISVEQFIRLLKK